MKTQMAFCDECREDVRFTIEEKQLEASLKGEHYHYLGKIAHCTNCQSQLYIAQINDDNLQALYDAYRLKNNIIPLHEILAIPPKYDIGKRPLSLLLGWGEQTFSRYCDGDLPTKQYSEILQHINNDPHYYAQLLDRNQSNLKSVTTYEKSKKAVSLLLKNAIHKPSKFDFTIAYLLNQCQDITPLALQKALYYIQGFYYAFYQTFLFEEDCEAWVHGPVYREVYFRYKEYHFDPIETACEFDHRVFTASEKTMLDSIIRNLCCYSGKTLEQFTHSELPWLHARADLPNDTRSANIIPKSVIASYFSAVKEKYKMLSPADIKDYAQKMFEQL